MPDAFIIVGGNDTNEVVKDDGKFAYSSFNKNGDSPSGETTSFMNKKGKTTITIGDGTMLLDTLRDGSQQVSSEINKAVGKLDQLKNVTAESLLKQATETLKLNTTLKSKLGDVNLTLGSNGLEMKLQTDALKTNAISNIKVNDKKLEHLNFKETGTLGNKTLVDSQGQRIVPLEAEARANSEKGQDDERMNRFDHGSLLDGVGASSDEMLDNGSNLINECLEFFKNVDIEKLDEIIKNDKEFTNA